MIKSVITRGRAAQRGRILDAAIGVFGERGLKAATTRLVGRQCGVNSALIYYYFENKHTLFVEALRRVLAGFMDSLQQRQRPLAGARARLEFLVDGVLDYYSAHADRMQMISMALVMHPDLLAEVIQSILHDGPPLPLRVLAEGAARGELRRGNPLQAWWSILGLCLFALHAREVIGHVGGRLDPRFIPADIDRRRDIVDLLMNGLAKKGA
jgi:TetR/AcrR family transcriptional regulator